MITTQCDPHHIGLDSTASGRSVIGMNNAAKCTECHAPTGKRCEMDCSLRFIRANAIEDRRRSLKMAHASVSGSKPSGVMDFEGDAWYILPNGNYHLPLSDNRERNVDDIVGVSLEQIVDRFGLKA